ncbi:MAG: FtsK/SpoIIIE domain-containing protein [Planctomycetaceae bacterium]
MSPGDTRGGGETSPDGGALAESSLSQAVVSRLQRGIADRQRLEEELAHLDATTDRQAQWRFAHRLQELADELQQRVTEREATLETARAGLDADLAATQARIESAHADAEAALHERLAAAQQRAEAKFQENNWLLSSVTAEDSSENPVAQFERLQLQAEQSRDALQQADQGLDGALARVTALVEARRGRLEEPPPAIALPRDKDSLANLVTESLQSATTACDQLEREAVPQLLVGSRPWLLMLVVLAGAFAAGWFLVDPHWISAGMTRGAEFAAIIAGGAVAFALLFWMSVWFTAQPTLATAAEKVQQARSNATAAWTAWQKLADRELAQAGAQAQARQAALEERRGRSLRKFAEERDRALADSAQSHAAELSRLVQQRDRDLRQAIERQNAELLSAESACRRDTALARRQHDEAITQLKRDFETGQASAVQRQGQVRDLAEATWQKTRDDLQGTIRRWEQQRPPAGGDLERVLQANWSTPAEPPRHGLRLGSDFLRLADWPGGTPVTGTGESDPGDVSWPSIWPFPGGPALLLKGEGAGFQGAIGVLQLVMLRILATLPPGAVRFTVFDPVGLGENFAAFMNLADHDELLITHRIWTEPVQMEAQLAKLTEHMETVFQKYLRDEFASIEDYNRQAGEVAEPYRVLVIAGLPAGFGERALQRLQSIISKGARCGVATLLACDTRLPRPHGFDLGSLEELSTVLEWSDNRWIHRQPGIDGVELRPDPLPPPTTVVALVKRLGELSRNMRRVEVPFRRIAPQAQDYWTEDSRSQVRVPLGRAGATRLQYLQLGKGTSQHVLVAGKTGSGKSTLLNVIITDLALRYSPDELEFYLIDFKKGVEFKTYATHQLPHARAIAIESDREFGVSVLERLDGVLRERGDRFRAAGVQDIAAFRNQNAGERMPRVLLIVDEFQEFFVEDDRYSQQAMLLLDRLVRQGRAFGIHILLGSQTLGGSYSLPRTTIGQMAVRIALQCSEADAHLILSEDNSAARLLNRPGEAIYNDANGLIEGNSPFQVAWLGDDQRDEYLDAVVDLARQKGLRCPDQAVFEGNIPANPLRNAAWCAATRVTATAAAGAEGDLPPRFWLGESVAMTGPAQMEFPPRSGTNLLLVGQDAQLALGILVNAVPALQPSGTSSRVLLLAGDADARGSARWSELLACLPSAPELQGPTQSARGLQEFATELQRRQDEGNPGAAWFLVIDDLARFRDLRRGDDDYGFGGLDRSATTTPAQLFASLLKDGPALGLHVIAWCDSYNNVERWLGRQQLREFGMRVLFPMSATDSSNLMDSPAASRLGANRAIAFSEERGISEKFRPYGPPGSAWRNWFLGKESPPVESTSPQPVAESASPPETLDISEFRIS